MVRSNLKDFKSERELWDYLHDSKSGSNRREELHKVLNEGFPLDAKETRQWVELLLEAIKKGETGGSLFKYLQPNSPTSPAPEALELILTHGKFYEPLCYSRPPLQEPLHAQCYANALALMNVHNKKYPKKPMVYIEGIVVGIIFPMLHAWNAYGLRGMKADDWSCYATSPWHRYWGVPFTQEEMLELTDQFGLRGCFFNKESYKPKIGRAIQQIIKRRET